MGDNMLDVNTPLGLENFRLRKKISAAKAWPIAGDWQHLHDFHVFPKLPLEMRNKIWKFAALAEEPRVVNIYVLKGQLCCNVVTPRILHTSSEARQEALLTVYHELVFDGASTHCFVNFDRDWVFFDTTIALPKIFGANPAYPIFQQKCRKLAVQSIPLEVYRKTLSVRFTLLEDLALVSTHRMHYSQTGGGYLGNVAGFYPPNNRSILPEYRLDLMAKVEETMKKVPTARVTLVDAFRVRDGKRKIMTEAEKERARVKRKEERDGNFGLRLDESLAYQLQRELDMKKVHVEVHEVPLEDLDGEDDFVSGFEFYPGIFHDEFGLDFELDPDVFSDEFFKFF